MKTLLMDVKVGQSISIDGGKLLITLEEKSGQRIKIRFVHDGETTIARALGGPSERRRGTGAAQAIRGIRLAA